MAPNLILVADGAYPHPPYDFLPAEVRAWAGYVGGHTPHTWTDAEIAQVREAGLVFWAIWTAPVGQPIGAHTGQVDAAGTVAALTARGIPRTCPVFYDVEYSTWAADVDGAYEAVAAWKHGLSVAGYRYGYAYLPLAAGYDWVAHWTGTRPTSLPEGVIGVQYDHGLHGDAYDLSVFHSSLLALTGGTDMALDPTDPVDSVLITRVAEIHDWVRRLSFGFDNDAATPFTERAELTHLARASRVDLGAVKAAVLALRDGQDSDVTALAAALATDLGPDLAGQLAAELAARLQS